MSLENYRPGHHKPAPWAPRVKPAAKAKPATPVDQEPGKLFSVAVYGSVIGLCALILWLFPFDTSTCEGSCRGEILLHLAKYFGLGALVLLVAAAAVGALCFAALLVWGTAFAVRDAFDPAKEHRNDLGGFVDAAGDGIIKAAVIIGLVVGLFWAVVIAANIIITNV